MKGLFKEKKGILRDVGLIEPTKLLLSNEVDGKVISPKSIALTARLSPDSTKKSSRVWGDR